MQLLNILFDYLFFVNAAIVYIVSYLGPKGNQALDIASGMNVVTTKYVRNGVGLGDTVNRVEAVQTVQSNKRLSIQQMIAQFQNETNGFGARVSQVIDAAYSTSVVGLNARLARLTSGLSFVYSF